jgi:hypothetical protein
MADKMTRKEALNTAIEIMNEFCAENWEPQDLGRAHTVQAIAVLEKMIAQIDKQATRPKGKTSARIQNENYARSLCQMLAPKDNDFVINAKWIADNVKGVMTSQRGYHVAQIAIEWNMLEEVMIKKRTFYAKTDNFNLENIPH